jgi:hypothetical protein
VSGTCTTSCRTVFEFFDPCTSIRNVQLQCKHQMASLIFHLDSFMECNFRTHNVAATAAAACSQCSRYSGCCLLTTWYSWGTAIRFANWPCFRPSCTCSAPANNAQALIVLLLLLLAGTALGCHAACWCMTPRQAGSAGCSRCTMTSGAQ